MFSVHTLEHLSGHVRKCSIFVYHKKHVCSPSEVSTQWHTPQQSSIEHRTSHPVIHHTQETKPNPIQAQGVAMTLTMALCSLLLVLDGTFS